MHDKGTRYEALQTIPQCAFCDMRLEDRGKGMMLRNCDHCLHKSCLEDMFRLKKSKCPTCDLNLADGFDKSISVAKVKRAPGLKKKGTNEEAKKILQEIQERVQPLDFAIAGLGVAGHALDGGTQ